MFVENLNFVVLKNKQGLKWLFIASHLHTGEPIGILGTPNPRTLSLSIDNLRVSFTVT